MDSLTSFVVTSAKTSTNGTEKDFVKVRLLKTDGGAWMGKISPQNYRLHVKRE